MQLEPIGELELKGLSEPIAVCEVVWSPIAVRTLELPLPRAISLAPRFSLAGRDDELDQLITAWKQASVGSLRTVLIAGEPGIGKTRLATETARAAALDGGFVLLGRCDDGMGVPYQPFVEALAHVVVHAPDDQLPALLGSSAGELCRLVPELAQRLPGATPAGSDPETERYLLFEAIAGWLEAQSRIAPTLLVLDDIHWAAEPTLRLLRHVLRSDRDLSLLVIGTYRDTEVDRTHPLGALLADLRRNEAVERIGLGGLDDIGMADLVERASGRELSEQARELARVVHAETGGNPFFAIEVLVSLAERGAIYQDADGAWVSDMTVEEVGIPEGVKEVVGQRLSALPEICDGVSHAAAVTGQEFELDLLASIADTPMEQVIDALEAARVAGLIDELGGSPVRYRFAHALVQQTLLDEIPTARRLRFHRALAEAIESKRVGSIDRYRAALARHWYEAGTEPARALEAMLIAAELALEQFADREALRWLAQSSDILDDAGASALQRIDVMTMTGEALRRIGDASHREMLLEAGRLAERAGDATRMARAALANGRGWQSNTMGVDAERVAALEAAIDALGPDDPGTRAQLLVRLAVEKTYEPDRSARIALADDALATARAYSDPLTLANVLSSRHNVIMSHETIDQRRSENEELIGLARDLGDPRLQCEGQLYAPWWRLQTRDVVGAHAAAEKAEELARRLGQPLLVWIVTWIRAGLARLAGDLDDAEALAERALAVGTDGGVPDAALFYAFQRLTLIVDRCAPTARDELHTYCDAAPPHYPGGSANLALMDAALGAPSRARDELDLLAASPHAPWSETGGPHDAALVVAAWFAAGEAALGEASPWDSAAYDCLAPWPGQLFGNVMWHGPTETYLAAIAPLAGHPDALDALLETGLTICKEMNAPLNELYARIHGACGLRIRGRSGDRDHARYLVDEAIALGDRLGAGFARSAAEHFPTLAD